MFNSYANYIQIQLNMYKDAMKNHPFLMIKKIYWYLSNYRLWPQYSHFITLCTLPV